MKLFKSLFLAIIIVSLASCATAVKFPISEVVPAAEISIETKKIGDYNYMIILKMINLSSPQRLTPPQKFYVIWAVSKTGLIRNIGYFMNENVETIKYEASFPYIPSEVFITGEENEELQLPNGIEISRIKL